MFLSAISLLAYFKLKITIVSGLIFLLFTYLILLLRTIQIRKTEFKEKIKLVGTFKVIIKKQYRSKYHIETKFKIIPIDKFFYEKISVNDYVKIEKLKSGRILNVEVFISN